MTGAPLVPVRVRTQRLAALVLALVPLGTASEAQPAPSDEVSDAARILRRAFEQRFDTNLASEIELVMEDRNGRRHRRIFDAAAKLIDGRHHSLGKLLWPHHLRDLTILTIEAPDRDHDAFVYLPTLGRVRRISSSQKGDAFFGTDVTYEDLERRRVEDLEILELEQTTVQGEPGFRIRVRPRERLTYSQADYLVAASDHALLEMRYYRERERMDGPFRTVTATREDLLVEGDHIVPRRLVVRNLARKTTTIAIFRDLELDPELDDRLFSVTVLERNPELRGRIGRGRDSGAGAGGAPPVGGDASR